MPLVQQTPHQCGFKEDQSLIYQLNKLGLGSTNHKVPSYLTAYLLAIERFNEGMDCLALVHEAEQALWRVVHEAVEAVDPISQRTITIIEQLQCL